jgi:EmrB/QacA subfamily drug resistance transporter
MKNSRWLSLIVLCAGFLLIVVDMTIVNVALPSIQRDLGFSQSGLAWVVNAYLIAFAGLLLLAGRLGDLVGRKRVYLIGLGIFIGASLLCGFSYTQPMLIAARFIQGIGGAVSSAVILAMIVNLFPEPFERAKAFGIFGFIASAGAAVGLLAGGLITGAVSWHWIFFVNLPIGLVTAALSVRLLESDKGMGLRQGADVLGAVMVTAALMLGVYTIIQTSDYGLGSMRTIVLGAITIAVLAAFVARQATGRNPILPLRIFRSRMVSVSNVVQALMNISFLSFFFLGSLDMQRVMGYGPLEIGMAFLPVALVMAVFSIRFSAALIARFGPWAMLITGQIVVAAALLMLGFGPAHPNYVIHMMVPLALMGLGGGLSFPALTIIAMAEVPMHESGLASGLLNTTGQVGGAFGLAVLATVAGSRTVDMMHSGSSLTAALAGGYHFAWLVGAGVVVITLVVAFTLLRSQRPVAMAEMIDEEAVA